MSFGFSVGDFIAVGSLIYQLAESLREGGSASEYRQVVNELGHLQNALSHLEKLNPNAELVDGVNALLKDCRQTLEEWLGKISKFDRHLGHASGASTISGKAVLRKMQWRFREGIEAGYMRSRIMFYIQSFNLLLSIESRNSTVGISSRIEDVHSIIRRQVDAQSGELNQTMRNTALTVSSELRPTFASLATNVEAIRTSMEEFVQCWNVQRPGQPPSPELRTHGRQLCAVPESFDWASIDPRIQALVLQRLYNRMEKLRPSIAADLDEICKEQRALRNDTTRITVVTAAVQRFVNGAITHVQYMSLLYSGPLTAFLFLRVATNPNPDPNTILEVGNAGLQRQTASASLILKAPSGQQFVTQIPRYPVAVRFGKHAEGLIRVRVGGCKSVNELLARVSHQYQALYRKKWVSWLMISRITRFTIAASDDETLYSFQIALALSITGYLPYPSLGLDVAQILAEMGSQTHATINPQVNEPFIWVELGPDEDRIWKFAGYTCIYNHLYAAILFYNLRYGYLGGLRVLSDVVAIITFTGFNLCFIREPPYSHCVRSQSSDLMRIVALFQVVAAAVELYFVGWRSISTAVCTFKLVVLTFKNDNPFSAGSRSQSTQTFSKLDIAITGIGNPLTGQYG